MPRQNSLFIVFGLLLSSSLVGAEAVHARSIVGSDSNAEEEDKADRQKSEKADDAKSKAKEEADAKKAAEKAEKERKQEEARLKAEQEAKEAALKKEAEKAKQEQEAIMRERRKQREKRDNLLAQSKERRNYVREFSGHKALITVTPGSEGKNKVVEVTFQVHKLSSDSASLGKAKVLKKLASATATVGPKKRRRGKGETYKLHRISRAGTYGFHYTPTMAGVHQVEVNLTDGDGSAFSFELPLYVGVWPPPDFPQEEEAYQNATQGQGRNRRIMSLD